MRNGEASRRAAQKGLWGGWVWFKEVETWVRERRGGWADRQACCMTMM
jgi:hypothetical protein